MWCALSKALDAEAKRVQEMSKDDQTKEDLTLARQKLHEAEERVEELETSYWSQVDSLPKHLKQQWINSGCIKFDT